MNHRGTETRRRKDRGEWTGRPARAGRATTHPSSSLWLCASVVEIRRAAGMVLPAPHPHPLPPAGRGEQEGDLSPAGRGEQEGDLSPAGRGENKAGRSPYLPI